MAIDSAAAGRTLLDGHFGPYGGRFVPEALTAALDELDDAFQTAITDPAFALELQALERDYTGRPSPLTPAARFSEACGGARVYLKREEECLAACACAPMMVVNGHYHEKLTTAKVDEILDGLK